MLKKTDKFLCFCLCPVFPFNYLPKQKILKNSLCVSLEETIDGGKEMVQGILEDVVESAVKGSEVF